MYYCCVRGCGNNTEYNLGLSFFSFPKDPERCSHWIKQCGRVDLKNKSPLEVHNNYRICANHFEDQTFAGLSKSRLKKTATPTLRLVSGEPEIRELSRKRSFQELLEDHVSQSKISALAEARMEQFESVSSKQLLLPSRTKSFAKPRRHQLSPLSTTSQASVNLDINRLNEQVSDTTAGGGCSQRFTNDSYKEKSYYDEIFESALKRGHRALQDDAIPKLYVFSEEQTETLKKIKLEENSEIICDEKNVAEISIEDDCFNTNSRLDFKPPMQLMDEILELRKVVQKLQSKNDTLTTDNLILNEALKEATKEIEVLKRSIKKQEIMIYKAW